MRLLSLCMMGQSGPLISLKCIVCLNLSILDELFNGSAHATKYVDHPIRDLSKRELNKLISNQTEF